ncbi:uncharacterized protein LOC144746217 [Ciona intestinalis]
MITSGSDILNYLGFKKLNKNLREQFSERAKISLVVTEDSVYIQYTAKDNELQSLLEDFDKFFSNFSSQLVSGNEAELSKLRSSYNWTEDEEKIKVRIGSTVMHVFARWTTDGVQITGQTKQVDAVVKEFERLLNLKTVTLPICESYYKRIMKHEALQTLMVNDEKVEVTCNPTDYSVTFTGSAKDVDQAELCFMRKFMGFDPTPIEKQSIAIQVENSDFMKDCHVQTKLNTVQSCETQTTPMVEETSSTETQTENIAMLMTLNEYEVGVVTFWESCQQLPSICSKYDVEVVSSKNGNQTIKISSKNSIEFMQEFQSLYNDAKLKMQHKFMHVSERSKNLKKQLKVLNDTCNLVHCAFYYDAPNLMVVMGTDNAMLDHCHSQLQSQKNTNENPTQSFGFQVSSHSQAEERPVKSTQQNTTELPSNVSAHGAVEKEYSDTISVDKDVYSYIQLSKANRVKRIWERHPIKIKTTKVGQDNLSIELTSKDEERIVQAIDEFQRLYQDTIDHIQQEDIECELDLLDSIERAVDVVRTSNDVFVCQSSNNKHRVIMLSEDTEALKASKRVFKHCLNSGKPIQIPKQPPLASRDNYIEVFKFVTKSGVSVSVGTGNIALQDVDAIVNDANDRLRNGAGVTGAIFKQGGWEFGQVCQKAMKRRSNLPLDVGEVVSVRATGDLKCKRVLHLVGPQWYNYHNKKEAYQLLESGLISVLMESDHCGATTLALPPVATGVYGTPLKVFVQAMNTALTYFEASYPRSTRVLNYIRILSIDQSTVGDLATRFSSSVEKERSLPVDPSSHHHHTSAHPLGGNDEPVNEGEVPMEIDDVYDGHSSSNYQSNSQQSPQSTSQVTEKKSYAAAAAKPSSQATAAVCNELSDVVKVKQQTGEWTMAVVVFPQTASTESMYLLQFSIPSPYNQNTYKKTAYIPNVEGSRKVIKRIEILLKKKKLFQQNNATKLELWFNCKLKCLAFSIYDTKGNYMEKLHNELMELEKEDRQEPTEKESEKRKNSKKEKENGKGKESKTEKENEKEQCLICLDDITGLKIKTLPCKHRFHEICVNTALKVSNLCPICKQAVGKVEGNQPYGTMRDRIEHYTHLPGYEHYGAIVINYHFPSGTQGPKHPNPGVPYTGTSRTAYLPDNSEGREVLRLLKKAFDARLIFTIGRSVTTGMDNQVTWNDIHHKTNTRGGATRFGYPDPDYLNRVKDELKAKGIQ